MDIIRFVICSREEFGEVGMKISFVLIEYVVNVVFLFVLVFFLS